MKILEEKKLQQKRLEDKKKAQPSKEAAQAYLEKRKEEARQRAERETRELLEKKRKKLEQEKLLRAETTSATKPTNPPKKPSASSSSNTKPSTSSSSSKTQNSKTSNTLNTKQNPKQASSSSSSKNPVKPKRPTNTSSAPPKPTLTYQDILKLADNNQNKPKTTANQSETLKHSHTTSASENALPKSSKLPPQQPSSKLTPEQIAKLREKHKLANPNSAPKPNIRTDLNNNKTANRPRPSSTTANLNKIPDVDKFKPGSSVSAWDRIVSDMKKKQVKTKSENNSSIKKIKKNANSNESDVEDVGVDEEDEYDSEMEDFIDDQEEDREEYSKCIRKIFNYNPDRYKHVDDEDLDDMETDFHSQLKEEKRSLKLGILEDIEEMRREAEMEKRRMEKKKRQLDAGTEKSTDVKKMKK